MNLWIGVDLDGTLSITNKDKSISTIGKPIPLMIERVKAMMAEHEVRIFTARVGYIPGVREDEFIEHQTQMIQDWTYKHLGKRLRVTAIKDLNMIKLYDNIAVSVETDTGNIK